MHGSKKFIVIGHAYLYARWAERGDGKCAHRANERRLKRSRHRTTVDTFLVRETEIKWIGRRFGRTPAPKWWRKIPEPALSCSHEGAASVGAVRRAPPAAPRREIGSGDSRRSPNTHCCTALAHRPAKRKHPPERAKDDGGNILVTAVTARGGSVGVCRPFSDQVRIVYTFTVMSRTSRRTFMLIATTGQQSSG
jgi:hypothetical protein